MLVGRNIYIFRLKVSHEQYLESLFDGDDNQSNNKRFWSYIKSLRGDQISISALNFMGKLVTKRVEKVKALSHQYQQVFTQEDTTSFPKLGKSPYGKMPKINITTEGVEKLLKQLNPNKAVGPDMLPTQVMKDHAELITPMLSKIFQQSLDTGDVPNDWRNANITSQVTEHYHQTTGQYHLHLSHVNCWNIYCSVTSWHIMIDMEF